MSEKISQMPAASALTGTELVPIVQSSDNVRTTTQGIADLGGGYPAYIAYLTVAGANAPEVTVIKNTLGININWTHGDVGESWGTRSSGVFDVTKTQITVNPDKSISIIDGSVVNYNYGVVYNDKVEVITVTPGDGSTNDFDVAFFVEIRVYP